MKDKNHFKHMDAKADLMRKYVWDHLAAVACSDIEKGGMGAVVTSAEDADGCCLVDQENGTLCLMAAESGTVMNTHRMSPT